MTLPLLVIGGGLAGLLAASRLTAAGERVVLIEARDRLGGTVVPGAVAGIPMDAGAESFATRGGVVERLLRELGLGDDLVLPAGGPAWLLPADRPAVPLPATSLLGIPARPLAADVITAVGWTAAVRAAADRVLPRGYGGGATSIGALVTKRMGRGMFERLVAPIVAGVHSSDARALAVDRVAPGLLAALRQEGSLAAAVRSLRAAAPAGAAVAGVRGGVHRLTDALAARLGDAEVLVGTRAEDVTPDGVRIGGALVRGRVILAAAPAVERRVHLTTLVLDAPELDDAPRGTGVLAAAGAPVRARALTHATAKWAWLAEAAEGRHVLRLSSDDELDDATARRDAEKLLGIRLPAPEAVARATWTRAAPAIEAGIPLIGEAVAGTGIANVVRHTESRIATMLGSEVPGR